MSRKQFVIYVPGLGDYRPRGQKLVIRLWRIFGVRGHYQPMFWADKEPFAPKLARLLALIDRLSVDGNAVSLVGSSAGASAVLIAFAARRKKVTGVACVCGKINHPYAMDHERFRANPAFQESLTQLQRVLPTFTATDHARIMSVRPLADGTVPPADTIIEGAVAKVIPTRGHAFSIACALTLWAPSILRFLKQ